MNRVFISYRRVDSEVISTRIAGALSKHLGRKVVFIDTESIPMASDYKKIIISSLGQSGIVLAVIGRQWSSCVDRDGRRRLESSDDSVRYEIESALDRDIPVLPVLVDGATMPGADELPGDLWPLARRQAKKVHDDERFGEDIRSLARAIREILAASRRRVFIRTAWAGVLALVGVAAGIGIDRIISVPTPRDYGDSDQILKIVEGDGYAYRHEIKDGNVTFVFDAMGKFKTKATPIPITLGRKHLGSTREAFHVLELFGRNPLVDADDFPELVRDTPSKHLIGLNYFKNKVGGSYLGTIVRATPQFSVPGEGNDHQLPTVEKAMITTSVDGEVRVETRSHFGTAADVTIVRTYSIPTAEATTATLSIEFTAEEDIDLGERGSKTDLFRFLTLSSYYENNNSYDASVILYENGRSKLVQLPLNHPSWKLNDPEWNNVHIFREVADEFRGFGSRVDLINEPGSLHYKGEPTPSIRLDVVDPGGLRLGLEGFLYREPENKDRTLDIWIEWLDAPRTIRAGTHKKVTFKLTASAPKKVEEHEPLAEKTPVLPKASPTRH